MADITVIKQNHLGAEMFRWKAKLVERGDSHIQLEARFSLSGHFMGEIPLEPGDRFIETYYSDRWYNSYEVHAHDDDRLKCWYCNVAFPAEIGEELVVFRDLALDLLVYPDGRQVVLDENEFVALDLPPGLKAQAQGGLQALQDDFRKRFAK